MSILNMFFLWRNKKSIIWIISGDKTGEKICLTIISSREHEVLKGELL